MSTFASSCKIHVLRKVESHTYTVCTYALETHCT